MERGCDRNWAIVSDDQLPPACVMRMLCSRATKRKRATGVGTHPNAFELQVDAAYSAMFWCCGDIALGAVRSDAAELFSSRSSFGPTVEVEFDPIKNWLEITIGKVERP